MLNHRLLFRILPALGVLLFAMGVPLATPQDQPAPQLPEELRGAKVYKLPQETQSGKPAENPVIYKTLSYQDINLERLVLNLSLSVKPVDRGATVRRIYFQDVRADDVPVHVETFDSEFKLSKKGVVDLPAPLKCSIVFAELGSLSPVKRIVDQDKLRITGQSFIEIKLGTLEKVAVRAKQLVIPVTLNEEVPLKMFSGNPLLQMAASRILDTLADPSTAAAMALAKEHLTRTSEDQKLVAAARPALYLLYVAYTLTDPKTQASEKFTASGTGFVVSADGKLLTAKRVVQPWKFDPQVAFLMARYHLELDPASAKYYAWPAGTKVVGPDGQFDAQAALRSENQTLTLLKTAPDETAQREYKDPDSGEQVTLTLHAEGPNDAALLQLVGSKFSFLSLASSDNVPALDVKTALYSFPYGLNQSQPEPQVVYTKASVEGPGLTLDHTIGPGESGAPLLSPDGKVLALAGSENVCLPLSAARTLLP